MTVHDGGASVSQYDDGKCGAPTQSGDPCQRKAGEGGTCGLKAHEDPGRTSYPPPEHLGSHGSNLWRSLVDEAVRLGILTQLDYPVFIKLCEQWEMSRLAYDQIMEEGTTVEGRHGEKAHPAKSVWNESTKEVRQLLGEMGFTPSARGKMDLEAMEKGEEGIGQYMR